MSLSSGFKKMCESIAKDNNPAYAVVAIAVAKGIFRPLFTMMDKKESPETKKYTALREGLTEVIAIPTYLACGALAGKGAALIKDPEKATRARHNLRFVGVCTAALIVIPGLCSLVVKPFTDRIFNKDKKDDSNDTKKLDVTSKSPEVKPVQISQTGSSAVEKLNPVQHTTIGNFGNQGMRVG